jgi:outer membrane lipoprotein SlyB
VIDRHVRDEIKAWALVGAAVLLALALAGCWQSETRSTEKVTTQTSAIVLDTPIGQITAQPVRVEQLTEGQSNTKAGADVNVAGIASAALPFLPGGAAAGGIMGLAGAAFGAWRMLRERDANKAVEQTVKGVENFKAQIAPETADLLHNHLSRAMDESAKAKVKAARAKV